MKHTCPCGCGREVPNGRFYADGKSCYRRGEKLGIGMPRGGEIHAHERLMKKVKAVRRKYGNWL